jgi:hypothetical protein
LSTGFKTRIAEQCRTLRRGSQPGSHRKVEPIVTGAPGEQQGKKEDPELM